MKRRINPPHFALMFLVVEFILWRWFPLWRWSSSLSLPLGLAVVALGILLALWAVRLFVRKKTGLVPFSESTALLTEGPYRFTRNPIYLGMTLLLIGAAVALSAASPFIAPPLFVALITARFILPEEAHMERAFGGEYLNLKQRVRRWL